VAGRLGRGVRGSACSSLTEGSGAGMGWAAIARPTPRSVSQRGPANVGALGGRLKRSAPGFNSGPNEPISIQRIAIAWRMLLCVSLVHRAQKR
jgi:hypothetical protein